MTIDYHLEKPKVCVHLLRNNCNSYVVQKFYNQSDNPLLLTSVSKLNN